VEFARRYGTVRPAALIPGLSIQRTVGGEETTRMAAALQVATGNVGIAGGSTGGNIWNRLPGPRCETIVLKTDVKVPGVPVYRWPDAVLEGRKGGYPTDIKAVYNVGGNYLCQGSDIQKSIKAFKSVEFSVCHDYFLTPTACHSDIVLPATTFLEREDIVFPEINYLFFSSKAIEPLHRAKNDYDIFCELSEKLGFLKSFSEGKTGEEWLANFAADSDIVDYEEFKRTGIYKAPDQLRVGLSDFVSDPESNRLSTPSGLIEIASSSYAGTGFPEIPTCRILPSDTRFPLRLITPHARYRINSQYSNISWFQKREEQVLWINPAAAEKRSIRTGEKVIVQSVQGRLVVECRVTEDIMPGAVCLLAGAWPLFVEPGTDCAGAANILTSTEPTEPSQGSRTHSVLVEVSAFDDFE
jgi:anaerobic dimethyl sulfoxide reductase subunit A